MSAEIFKIVAKYAGVPGIALLVIAWVFRDIINSNISSNYTPNQSFMVICLIIIAITFVASLAIIFTKKSTSTANTNKINKMSGDHNHHNVQGDINAKGSVHIGDTKTTFNNTQKR